MNFLGGMKYNSFNRPGRNPGLTGMEYYNTGAMQRRPSFSGFNRGYPIRPSMGMIKQGGGFTLNNPHLQNLMQQIKARRLAASQARMPAPQGSMGPGLDGRGMNGPVASKLKQWNLGVIE